MALTDMREISLTNPLKKVKCLPGPVLYERNLVLLSHSFVHRRIDSQHFRKSEKVKILLYFGF